MALFIRHALRPLRPHNFCGGWATTVVSRSTHGRSAKPRVRIQTGADESDLTHEQLEDLFAGQFPVNCADEVVHLSNLSCRNFRKIVNAFDTSNEDDRRPSGHLFFDRKLSKISVYLAPIFLHESAIHKVQEAVWDVIRSKVSNYDELFDLRTNAAEKHRADFTTKAPDIMISHAPDAATISSPFFLAEVGFSESYEDLVKTMKFWLNGYEKIKMAFLIKFQESPRYSGKKCFLALPKDVVANAEQYANDRDAFKTNDSDGILQAFGAPLVGRITAFLEIWERTQSGNVVLRGERTHFYDSLGPMNPPKIALDFDEFGIPVEELQGQKININWNNWIAKMARARKELAWDRFCNTPKGGKPRTQQQQPTPESSQRQRSARKQRAPRRPPPVELDTSDEDEEEREEDPFVDEDEQMRDASEDANDVENDDDDHSDGGIALGQEAEANPNELEFKPIYDELQ
ncbi:hypothetical protein FQN50_005672 [Emmonsiellopsis sp. PD_5]|nr:hypothetical protein FQN50_005672 [Emmonsiellopsis sp. PD_5]